MLSVADRSVLNETDGRPFSRVRARRDARERLGVAPDMGLVGKAGIQRDPDQRRGRAALDPLSAGGAYSR
jgi:hypothetical protein